MVARSPATANARVAERLDPAEARCAVPDERFDWLCELYKPASRVPAYLTVVDIAGLVKGAAEGQGLGNAFLSHIRAVDAIFHVVRMLPWVTQPPLAHCALTAVRPSVRAACTHGGPRTAGAFDSEEIAHVEGDVNPIRDLQIIHEELRYAPFQCRPIDDVHSPKAQAGTEQRPLAKPSRRWTAAHTGSRTRNSS